MATYYSQNTGNWSTLANWNSEADGSGSSLVSIAAMDDQIFIIQAGHVITFDIEDAPECDGSISGLTNGIAGIIIEGTESGNPGELTLSTTANNIDRVYCLKLGINAQIIGTNNIIYAKLTGGNEISPIPKEATHIIYSLGMTNNNAIIDLSYLNISMYCYPPIEPAYQLVSTNNNELTVTKIRNDGNDDPSLETEWKAGWEVIICNSGKQDAEFEKYILADPPTDTNKIFLTTELSTEKNEGSLICLSRRNIEFRCEATGSKFFANGNNGIFDCAIRCVSALPDSHAICNGIGHSLCGSGVISGFYNGVRYSDTFTIKDNALFTGCYRGLYSSENNIIQDKAIITGCNYPAYQTNNLIITDNTFISGCNVVLMFLAGGFIQGNTIISGCNYIIQGSNSIIIKDFVQISNCNAAIYGGINNIIQGNVTIDSCNYAIVESGTNENNGSILQGNTIVTNCIAGIYGGKGNILQENASISLCTYGIFEGSYHIVRDNAIISICNYGIYKSIQCLVFKSSLINNIVHFVIDYNISADDCGSTYVYNANITDGEIINNSYLALNIPNISTSPRLEIWPELYEPYGLTINERRWPTKYNFESYPTWYCNGGYGISQTETVPNGFTAAAKMTFEQPADKIDGPIENYSYNWIAFPIQLIENGTTSIKITLRKNVNFNNIQLPKIEIIPQLYDGNNIYTGEAYKSISIFDESNNWRTYHLKITSDGPTIFTTPIVFLRIIGAQKNGDLFFTVEIEPYEMEYKKGLQISLHAKHLIKNGSSGYDMWQHPLLENGEKPWTILTASDVSRTYLAGAGEGFKYYFAGANTTGWYAGDRVSNLFYKMPELQFSINVINNHYAGFLLFDILVENSKAMGELTFSINVLMPLIQLENLTNEEYAAYYGYKLPLWNKIENSDNIENIRQFNELKNIRSLMSEIGPPSLFESDRAGPFAWNKYDYIDNAEDSEDKDLSGLEKLEKIAGIETEYGDDDENKIESYNKYTIATSNIIAGSNWGLWLGEGNHGISINRLYHLWDNKNDPLILVNQNDISDSLYTEDYISQSIVFNNPMKIDDIVLMEKDFKEYYLADGPWEIDNTDIFVYINNQLANISWEADKNKGLIRFRESLRNTDRVTVSILKKGAYLTNVGTYSHFELDGFEDNPNYATELTEELKASNNSYITVASTKNFPANTQYIKIGNTERIHVAIDSQSKDRNTFKIITARSNPISWGKGTPVILSEIVSSWGIQDILSKYTSSNISYNMHSVFVSNLIRTTLALKEHLSNIDGPIKEIPDGWTGEDGQIQKYYIDMDDAETDYDLDELNSWTTLYRGVQPTFEDDPYQPLVIYCNYGKLYQIGSLLGTDHGIWRYDGTRWKKVCRCIRNYNDGTVEKSCRIYGFKDFRNELWAYTDVGIWTSTDSGKTWTENALYYQCIYDISSGIIDWWSNHSDTGWSANNANKYNITNNSEDHYYEIFAKEDGLIMVLYKDPSAPPGSGEFWSDFESGPDNYVFKQYNTKKDGDKAFIGKNEDLKYAYDAEENENRVIFSTINIINQENIFSNTIKTRIKINVDGKEEEEKYQEKLKFYKMIMNPNLPEQNQQIINEFNSHGMGLAEIIFLTNDGIRISNHNWLHMSATGQIKNIVFNHSALDGKNINCNCYLLIDGTENSKNIYESWKYYILLLGTNKGLFYSLDGGYNWAHMIKRFPNGGTSVYNLYYDTTISRLYVFTDAGIVYTDDMGATWNNNREMNPSSGYTLLENRKIAQTFIALDTEIIKASVYLSRQKNTDIKYLSEETLTPQIVLGLYNTFDNKPDVLLGYSETIYNFNDINCSSWYNFNLSEIATLVTGEKYAIVLETIYSGLTIDNNVQLITSSIKDPYEDGQLYINDGINWVEIENTDSFFLIHYNVNNSPEINEYSVTYNQNNANNIAVKNTYDSLYLDMRFMFSFIIDDTGSMKWMDKNNDRIAKVSKLINQVLSRNKWSYADIWTMGDDLNNLLKYGPSRDITNEIPTALGTLLSKGKNSEIWTGPIIASGGINEIGVNSVLEKENAYEWAINYMDSMERIDNNILSKIDPSYTGNIADLMLDKYKDLKNYVIQDFSDTYCRAVFYITDGFDSASHKDDSWEDLALAINSLKFKDKRVPLYIFGIGSDNAQSGLIQASEATGGKYFNISENIFKWDEAINSIVDGDRDEYNEIIRKDVYLWKGKYEDYISFKEEAQYISSVHLPAYIPETSKVEFRMRWTKDFITWTPWKEYEINVDNIINAYIIYLEYEIILYQGDLTVGNPEYFIDENYGYEYGTEENYPSPVVGALKYYIVTPSKNIYIMNERTEKDSILEYLLTSDSIIPKDAKINWKLIRGACHNWELFENLHTERKGVLPVRSGTIYFTPDMEQKNISLNPVASGSDPTKTTTWIAVDKNNKPITWGNNAQITVYLNGEKQEEGVDLQPLAMGKDYGLIIFTTPKDIVSIVIIDIVYPGGLQIADGEIVTRINENTVKVQNGPWAPDADVVVYINKIAHTDNFWTLPEEGKIVFKNPIDNDDITVGIFLSNKNRLGYEIINYTNTPFLVNKAGLMYSTNIKSFNSYDFSNYTPGSSVNYPILSSIFKQKITSEQILEINQEQLINLIIGNMNSRPYIDYDFEHIYNYIETNTKIIWERDRGTGYIELPEMEDKLSMPISSKIMPYGSDTSNLFIEGDILRAKIYLRTSLAEGNPYITNQFKLGNINEINNLPILTNVKLYYLKTNNIEYTKPNILPDLNNPTSLLTKNIIEIGKVGYRDESGTLYNVYEFRANELTTIWIKCEINIDNIFDENNLEAIINRIIKYSRIQWFNSRSENNIPIYDNYILSRATVENPYANWSLPANQMTENEEYWYAVITPRINPPELVAENDSSNILMPLELGSTIKTRYVGEEYPSNNFSNRIRVENIMKLSRSQG